MATEKDIFIGRWRENRDFHSRGAAFSFKAESGSNHTGSAAVSQSDDETVLALSGLSADYRITIEAEVADFPRTAPIKTREITLTSGPHADRYQILRVRKDELGALYIIDLGGVSS
jgi:hypothetical protein